MSNNFRFDQYWNVWCLDSIFKELKNGIIWSWVVRIDLWSEPKPSDIVKAKVGRVDQFAKFQTLRLEKIKYDIIKLAEEIEKQPNLISKDRQ